MCELNGRQCLTQFGLSNSPVTETMRTTKCETFILNPSIKNRRENDVRISLAAVPANENNTSLNGANSGSLHDFGYGGFVNNLYVIDLHEYDNSRQASAANTAYEHFDVSNRDLPVTFRGT